MSDITLPAPLDAYFAAKNRHDVGGMLACFAPDATALDEGHTYQGHAALRAWLATTTSKYRVTATPSGLETRDGASIVTALVAGNFPGSPASLRYAFSLRDGLIAGLGIA